MTREQRENLYLSLIDAINEDNDEKTKKALANFMNSSANEIRLALNSVGINDISEPMLIANLMRLVSVWRALKRIKRRYAFAPVEIPAGHKVQPTRAEILPELRRCRTELAAWCIIAAVTAYACVDCLIFWIMR